MSEPDLFALADIAEAEEEAREFSWAPFLEWHLDRVEYGAYQAGRMLVAIAEEDPDGDDDR